MKYQYKIHATLKIMLLFLCGSPVYGSEKVEMKIYQFYETFEIKPNLWFVIEDGLKIQFISHSHKRTLINEPASPLIVTMKYELSGKTSQEQHNIHPNKTSQTYWEWNNYKIQLVNYTYAEKMTLIINKIKH